jgi:hypothetical protein
MANITVGYLEDGTPCDYTTIEAGAAAMTGDDTLQLYYGKSSGLFREEFLLVLGTNGLGISGNIEGMLPNMRCYINVSVLWVGIHQTNLTTDEHFCRNFTINYTRTLSSGYSVRAVIEFSPTNGDIVCENILNQSHIKMYVNYASTTTYFIARNVISLGGLYTYRQNSKMYNCTFPGAFKSALYYISNHIFVNCVAESWTNDGNGVWADACSNNASADATAPGSNPLINQTQSDVKFIRDNSGVLNLFDFRIVAGSSLIGAGTPYESLTLDISGQTRPNPPSIGASEEVSLAVDPDFPDVQNVLTTDTTNGTTGRWVKADSEKYKNAETFGVDGTSETGEYVSLATTPSAPTLDSITLSDTTATLSFTGGTDDIYARYRLMNGVADWSDENGTFSRTGSGTVSITGLTNDVAYEFVGYAKNASDAYSTPTSPIFGIPSSGTSDIKKLISAIVAEINTAQILESNGTAIVAEKEIPPRFDSVNNAIIKVFPDSTTSSPIMSNITRNRYRIATCICWRADDSDKIDGMLAARDQLINLLTGKRLTAYTEAFCVGEVEANAFDYDSLKDSQNFICPITFEFQISKRRE